MSEYDTRYGRENHKGTGAPASTLLEPLRTSPMDREWSVVAAAAAGLTFSLGTLLLYTFGVFAGPLIHEFGWTRTQAAVALAVSQYTFAFSAPAWGMMIDRFGPRAVIVGSVIGMSLVVASLSLLTQHLWQYYLTFAAASFLAGAASPIGYAAVIVGKFERHLGLALGLALMGVGIGATVLPPLSQALVGALGWRGAFLVLGALTFVVTLPAALVATRNAPRRVASAGAASKPSIRPLVQTRAFVVMCAIFVLIGTLSIGGLASLVPLMISRGVPPIEAAQVASVTGLATIAGRGGIGYVLDRVYAPFVVCAVALLATASFLLFAYSASLGLAYLAAALLGAVVGAEVDFTAFFVRRYFGQAAFGQMYGLVFGLFIVGSGTGPVLMSAASDHFGGYRAGMVLFAAASATVALLTFAMPRYQVPVRRSP